MLPDCPELRSGSQRGAGDGELNLKLPMVHKHLVQRQGGTICCPTEMV